MGIVERDRLAASVSGAFHVEYDNLDSFGGSLHLHTRADNRAYAGGADPHL